MDVDAWLKIFKIEYGIISFSVWQSSTYYIAAFNLSREVFKILIEFQIISIFLKIVL
jgi:hypothetical protein